MIKFLIFLISFKFFPFNNNQEDFDTVTEEVIDTYDEIIESEKTEDDTSNDGSDKQIMVDDTSDDGTHIDEDATSDNEDHIECNYENNDDFNNTDG